MVLQMLVGYCHEGSAPLVSDLIVAYEAHQGLLPDRSSYTDTDKSVEMLSLNSLAPKREVITTIFKVFGMTQPRESSPGPPVTQAGALPLNHPDRFVDL